jgi:hypothetical protein
VVRVDERPRDQRPAGRIEDAVELGGPEDAVTDPDDDGRQPDARDDAREQVSALLAGSQVVGDQEDDQRDRRAPDVDARGRRIEAERPG